MITLIIQLVRLVYNIFVRFCRKRKRKALIKKYGKFRDVFFRCRECNSLHHKENKNRIDFTNGTSICSNCYIDVWHGPYYRMPGYDISPFEVIRRRLENTAAGCYEHYGIMVKSTGEVICAPSNKEFNVTIPLDKEIKQRFYITVNDKGLFSIVGV